MGIPLKQVQNFTNTLLLKASFINNLGLMHGKMGISIYFFHLARQTKNQFYEDYAGELLDEISDEMAENIPIDFEYGLAGIGWGIEYLVQNKFIEADTDIVLEEFDNRIFRELIYNMPREIGLLKGILGIIAYFLKRIQKLESSDEKISRLTSKQSLIHLVDELDRRLQHDQIEKLLNTEPEIKGTFEETETKLVFDITSEYPTLIWFLAEIYEQNIFNSKTEKIIHRLIEPLVNDRNLPKLQSTRLLFALALIKLRLTLESSDIERIIVKIETSSKNLFKGITRETINSELPQKRTTIKHGVMGIALIYKQLYKFTLDIQFKEEMEYWIAQSAFMEYEVKNSSIFEDSTNHKEKVFGILEGNTGIILTN